MYGFLCAAVHCCSAQQYCCWSLLLQHCGVGWGLVRQGISRQEVVTVVRLQHAPCSWLCSHASVVCCIVLCIFFGRVQRQQQQHVRQLRPLGGAVRLMINTLSTMNSKWRLFLASPSCSCKTHVKSAHAALLLESSWRYSFTALRADLRYTAILQHCCLVLQEALFRTAAVISVDAESIRCWVNC